MNYKRGNRTIQNNRFRKELRFILLLKQAEARKFSVNNCTVTISIHSSYPVMKTCSYWNSNTLIVIQHGKLIRKSIIFINNYCKYLSAVSRWFAKIKLNVDLCEYIVFVNILSDNSKSSFENLVRNNSDRMRRVFFCAFQFFSFFCVWHVFLSTHKVQNISISS